VPPDEVSNPDAGGRLVAGQGETMPDEPGILEDITAALVHGDVLVGDDVRGRVAWTTPNARCPARAVVRPTSTEEVSAVLRICHRHRQPVVTHGGRTGLVGGVECEAGDIVLSLERMNRIEEVDAPGRTMTVQAGVPLQQVQDTAEQHGLLFPLDMGARGSCHIGGNLATNAGGNRVIRYGMTRANVLGLEAVLADGTVISSLNRMIKNNAGYDLKQVFIGSEGTLGVITRVVLRLHELPRSQNAALVACSSAQHVVRLLKHADTALGGTLSAFEVMWNEFYRLVTTAPAKSAPPLGQDHAFYVLIESLGGNQASDDARFEEALGEAIEAGLIDDAVIAKSAVEYRTLWNIRDDVEQLFRFQPLFGYDVSLPIPGMGDYVDGMRRAITERWPDGKLWVFGHMGDGNLHVAVSAGKPDAETRAQVEAIVYQPLAEVGGSVSAEHGIGLEKKKYLPLSRQPAEIELMRTMKRALDPAGILNPGKLLDVAAATS
jgi:FAD/FMN-containing dehydrogenase